MGCWNWITYLLAGNDPVAGREVEYREPQAQHFHNTAVMKTFTRGGVLVEGIALAHAMYQVCEK